MIVSKQIEYFSTIEKGMFWLVRKIIAYGELNVVSIDILICDDSYGFELCVKESAENA